ncbi:retron Ec67 family RNA-directed DNA polymerase/endonuclease [Listeria booriae]|uniref:RNA-directed DNA polymerase n=1 Tax=Listeria booriae TaxID=1552123 RepID=A0A7X1CYY9_9LIST|nr:retron Ec67 family RNA-directed DNA polymerase/endonuclease [Listeria booriae]MBC2116769.1 RNA-directed DNA polymerase [Listeria booriae]
MGSFENIKTRGDLAGLLNIPSSKLSYILYIKKIENLYSSFKLPKKSGGHRVINSPEEDLKDIQKSLAKFLSRQQKIIWDARGINQNISHAFIEGKNIISNAENHMNKRFILNVDLEDFFDSFHFGRVRGFFAQNRDFRFPIDIATIIAQISCYNRTLPQGAPSSPIITNLICNILDIRLLKISKKYRVNYTRYADDLTFSTNDRSFSDKYMKFLVEISLEIKHAGFMINNKKTRLQLKDSRQEVTGLIVNKKVNVKKEYYKKTRAMADNLYRHKTFDIDGKPGTINKLEGRFSFINQLDRRNNEINRKRVELTQKSNSRHCLNTREKGYQYFLFYKYFFACPKPTIITEGKTDIRYLKAALKNLYLEFPKLIERKADGTFEFKVSFLRKTKRLKYFMELQLDGADTLKNIYNFYNEKGRQPNLSKYFEMKSKTKPDNPVIMVFDNEISNKNKPLYTFTNYASTQPESKQMLMKNLSINITNNLFLLTHQLVGQRTECEIEDLFNKKALDTKLDGKSFSKNPDTKQEYGKEYFSSYVLKNYQNIEFDNFRPMLQALNSIIESYSKG